MPYRKLNLDRFKKSLQGQIDFAILIEQAEPHHAEKIVEDAREVDPEFIREVMRRVVFFDELIYLDEAILAEILSKTPPKILAFALAESHEPFRKHVLRHLGYREMKTILDEEDKMGTKIGKNFILGAQRHILKIGRDLEAQNKFTFETLESPRLNLRKKLKKA